MSESALKGPEVKGCDAENQTHRVVSVEGYDTSLQPYYLKLLLKKYFSSCGKITDILVSREMETGLLKSSASIFFDGEGAEDKALNLSGNYFGGWKLVVAHENYSDDIEAEAVAKGEGESESEEEEEEEIDDNEFEYFEFLTMVMVMMRRRRRRTKNAGKLI
ncbi:Nucleolin 2 [Cardamine amara subsp. amara]|uniref:Nucleolin 2 n=1 Tax=Cardamine amara subsp. amara TaxID=228776 RepID=A0ABD1BCL4_CARAN